MSQEIGVKSTKPKYSISKTYSTTIKLFFSKVSKINRKNYCHTNTLMDNIKMPSMVY